MSENVNQTAMQDIAILAPLAKLTKDLKSGGALLSTPEARFLVDTYYMMQESRKRSNNQVLALTSGEEPHETLGFFSKQFETLEGQVRRTLDAYSAASPLGQWARSVVGIGPVIAAGLLAHIDLEEAPTVAHIWRYAGLDPTAHWASTEFVKAWVKELNCTEEEAYIAAADRFGRRVDTLRKLTRFDKDGNGLKYNPDNLAKAIARRPWNASLKTLCWKIGESFVKVCNHEDDFYGKLYLQRKAYETQLNEQGGLKAEAERALRSKNYGKSTDAYKAYSQGKLPPAHLHARAKRWAVKLFLSHYHERGYELVLGKPAPAPYAIVMLNHAHRLYPPVPKAA